MSQQKLVQFGNIAYTNTVPNYTQQQIPAQSQQPLQVHAQQMVIPAQQQYQTGYVSYQQPQQQIIHQQQPQVVQYVQQQPVPQNITYPQYQPAPVYSTGVIEIPYDYPTQTPGYEIVNQKPTKSQLEKKLIQLQRLLNERIITVDEYYKKKEELINNKLNSF